MSKRQSPQHEEAGPSRKRSREEEKEDTGPKPSSVKSRAQQYERMLSEKSRFPMRPPSIIFRRLLLLGFLWHDSGV
ncbi:hypothetical protein HNY73_008159 [Argiope bruennichi]|uniref:Uncharacterized protein n=1 Tax=Argiope bruennichi TaxID=94029 RepID=A0A8T0F5G5_ARGBR|nr:hypothetical protein HNY73_008159 [Argiope bruennichi]